MSDLLYHWAKGPKNGTGEGTLTPDRRIRNPLLYTTELHPHKLVGNVRFELLLFDPNEVCYQFTPHSLKAGEPIWKPHYICFQSLAKLSQFCFWFDSRFWKCEGVDRNCNPYPHYQPACTSQELQTQSCYTPFKNDQFSKIFAKLCLNQRHGRQQYKWLTQ